MRICLSLIFVLINSNFVYSQGTFKLDELFKKSNFKFIGSFKYSTLGLDTIGCEFFLVFEGDTINRTNRNGNRYGTWIDPYFLRENIQIDNIKMFRDMELKENSLTIDSITTCATLLTIADTISFYQTTNLNNLCLFMPRKEKIKDGYCIEEYWFGYLIGNYRNGCRIGTWKFLPLINGNLNFIINYNNFNLICDGRIGPYIKYYKIYSFEVGEYVDDLRQGYWVHSNFANSFFQKTYYNKGEFIYSLEGLSTNNLQKVYEIKIENGNKILYNYYQTENLELFQRYNINHVPLLKRTCESLETLKSFPLKD